MAHAHAADALDDGRAPRRARTCADRLVDLAAPLGHAAGAQPHADLAASRRPAERAAADAPRRWRLLPLGNPRALRRTMPDSDVAVSDLVDLDHRGQRAAAQAGHLLDRETAFGVGVVAVGQSPDAARRASWTSSEPLTWQAVPWQTLMMCRPTGRWRNWV